MWIEFSEKINIPRTLPYLTFLGNASDPPTITGNDTASMTGGDGTPLGTLKSATVAVNANYFVAINIKFEVKDSSCCHKHSKTSTHLDIKVTHGLLKEKKYKLTQTSKIPIQINWDIRKKYFCQFHFILTTFSSFIFNKT